MNLQDLLAARVADGRTVRAGLIGAGKFGSMFLSQVPTTPGLDVAAIADLSRTGRAPPARRSAGATSVSPRPHFSRTGRVCAAATTSRS